VSDLQHLREALKDAIEELAYRPVLSEFGDVGYLPQASAEDSCYITMRDCHVAVLIVGKRYGSVSSNRQSVTHNEFRTARESGIPVICLVDREVLSYKKVFDATDETHGVATFPGMDSAASTFALIQEVMDSPVNNGILPFDSVAEARFLLKTQLAHMFGDLLSSRFDPVKAGIKDVLSEVMTLRQELRHGDMDPQPFLRATRFLLDDANQVLNALIEGISGSVEVAVPIVLRCKTLDDYLVETETQLIIDDETAMAFAVGDEDNELVSSRGWLVTLGTPESPQEVGVLKVLRGNRVQMNSIAKRVLDYSYERLRKVAAV